MVTVPLRVLPGFDAMVSVTVPGPVPLAPDFTVINDALLTAVHAQVAALAPTLTVSVSPAPFALALAEPNANTHGAGVVVVVVVVVDGVVVELLEQAPANIAASSPNLATAAELVKARYRIRRI